MKRHLIYFKDHFLTKHLLSTNLCINEGDGIISCEDNLEVMKTIQLKYAECLRNTVYRDSKICFANEENYHDFVTV